LRALGAAFFAALRLAVAFFAAAFFGAAFFAEALRAAPFLGAAFFAAAVEARLEDFFAAVDLRDFVAMVSPSWAERIVALP
jgi:hypothetical protein